MKEHSVKAASLQFPQPGREFTFSLFTGRKRATAACQWPDRCRCVAAGIYHPSICKRAFSRAVRSSGTSTPASTGANGEGMGNTT